MTIIRIIKKKINNLESPTFEEFMYWGNFRKWARDNNIKYEVLATAKFYTTPIEISVESEQDALAFYMIYGRLH